MTFISRCHKNRHTSIWVELVMFLQNLGVLVDKIKCLQFSTFQKGHLTR